MATRTIPFTIDKADGTGLLTTGTPTATVQYGAGAAGAATVTQRENGWSVDVDDTQDALVIVTASGATTFGMTIARIPEVVASNMRGTDNALLAADYTAPPSTVGLATEANATANKEAVIAALPNDYAKPGDTMVPSVVTPPTDITEVATGVATLVGRNEPLSVQQTIEAVESATISVAVDAPSAEDIDAQLSETHGSGAWGRVTETNGLTITPATLDVDGFILGVVPPFAEITAVLDGVEYDKFDADGDGEYAFVLPLGSIWELRAVTPRYRTTISYVSTIPAIS